jgi:hypothetical protein
MVIDWLSLEGDFVALEAGVQKRMVLTNWRNQTKFVDEKTQEIKKGITFSVVSEDGKPVTKEWTLTAGKAINVIKPMIMKAEAAGKAQINIAVIKIGEGKSTVYQINEIVG